MVVVIYYRRSDLLCVVFSVWQGWRANVAASLDR